jgi:hypothetical protein
LTFEHKINEEAHALPSSLIEIDFYSHCKIKNNIPSNIQYINIFFDNYDLVNEAIENIPLNVKKIKIDNIKKIHYLKKIPFGHHSYRKTHVFYWCAKKSK